MKTFPTKGKGIVMQNRFIFYASFDEALKELSDKSRLKIYDAICDYALREIEPDFSGVEKIVFSLIKPKLSANLQRAKNGCKGGAPKNNQNARKVVFENNLKTTENQPKNNQDTTENQANETKRETMPPIKESSKENGIPPERENSPPTPQGAGDRELQKELFFEKYPALKGKKLMDDGIDYSVLIREFEQSSMLRGMYSFSKIASMYTAIERGDFRDKPKAAANPAVDAANARAARERFYAVKQAQAESVAYGYQKTAKENQRFCEIDRELAKLNLELAKAEIAGGDVTELKEYQEVLRAERGCILKKLGIEEWQLLPKYSCGKCNDSGYQADGRACDCYKEANVEVG